MQITFPVFDETEMGNKVGNHWYTLSLNIQAERFEALDSMREDSVSLVVPANAIIRKIKDIWQVHYNTSKVQIESRELKIINVPIQDTMYNNFFIVVYHYFFCMQCFSILVLLVFPHKSG
jgi:hypothetical protein